MGPFHHAAGGCGSVRCPRNWLLDSHPVCELGLGTLHSCSSLDGCARPDLAAPPTTLQTDPACASKQPLSDYLNPTTGAVRLKMTARASASKATLGGIIFALTSQSGGVPGSHRVSLTSSSPTGSGPDPIEAHLLRRCGANGCRRGSGLSSSPGQRGRKRDGCRRVR